MGKPIKYVTPELRLSYCHLFKPRAIKAGDDPKYSVSILIPKSDTKIIKAINDAVAQCTAENQDTLKAKKGLKHPLRDGDEKDSPEYEDHFYLSAVSKDKPLILDENRQPILESREIYSGMYGRVSFNFFAFNTAGNKGIACGLNAVQKTEDGEPLGATYTEDDAVNDFGSTSKSVKVKKKNEEVEEEDDDLL